MPPHRQPTKNLLLSLLVPLAGLGLTLLIAGCERKTKAEKAQEEVGEAIEAVGEAVEDAAK
ncbi:MAG: hypothetical protein O3A87_03960 [Verrucomicrobia bacterium]|nr:hypothetical protein [Verrucomicrobiota bacterium]MDA1005619.1 hypothetical protein [Verrucomicrobiota bacterium]